MTNAEDAAQNEGDRRTNVRDRDRIEELAEKFRSMFIKGLIGFSILGLSCGISIIGMVAVLNDRQEQRRDAAYTSCVLRNKSNTAIFKVLDDFKVPREKYRNDFPITPDCVSYARKIAP